MHCTVVPCIILACCLDLLDDHLLDVEFDLNPLKGEEEKQKVDQRIRLRLLPVEVIYDAVSVYRVLYMYSSKCLLAFHMHPIVCMNTSIVIQVD